MAIVISIIGLLVGGILVGMNLLRAAEIRSIVEEEKRIVSAAHLFKDKYRAWPGDLTNAAQYWGMLDATPATCKATPSNAKATCNGDGNGRVQESAASYEHLRFWQHLANAGLYEGKFTGTQALGASAPYLMWTPDNTPLGRINGTGYGVMWGGDVNGYVTGVDELFEGQYGHLVQFGRFERFPTLGRTLLAVLTPEEMLNFDLKYDDGRPGTGHIRTWKPDSDVSDCATSDNPAIAQYNVNNVDYYDCNVIFADQF